MIVNFKPQRVEFYPLCALCVLCVKKINHREQRERREAKRLVGKQ